MRFKSVRRRLWLIAPAVVVLAMLAGAGSAFAQEAAGIDIRDLEVPVVSIESITIQPTQPSPYDWKNEIRPFEYRLGSERLLTVNRDLDEDRQLDLKGSTFQRERVIESPARRGSLAVLTVSERLEAR